MTREVARTDQSVYIGVDTSNYTTSICAISESGQMVFEARRPLQVPLGDRGLQQSGALFQHIVHLPELLEQLSLSLRHKKVVGIGVSAKPRASEGSYMPVFHAGVLAAGALGAAAGVHPFPTTHQAGHIAAGLATSGLTLTLREPFLVLHLSGGTTDVLLADGKARDFGVREVATSLDLHIGQYVDRIGVQIGLPFPAGKHLETLARAWTGATMPLIPSVVRDGSPSFSGPLTAAQRLLGQGLPPEAVAAAVFRSISGSLEKMIRYATQRTSVRRVLLVGGVASNQIVRERLIERFGGEDRAANRLFFCDPAYASDNAYGVALIAKTESSRAN